MMTMMKARMKIDTVFVLMSNLKKRISEFDHLSKILKTPGNWLLISSPTRTERTTASKKERP